MAAEHNYKFNVKMTCSGCSGAVERVLKKLDGMHLASCPHPSTDTPVEIRNVRYMADGNWGNDRCQVL